jgi:putative FmdB family regulatory protein
LTILDKIEKMNIIASKKTLNQILIFIAKEEIHSVMPVYEFECAQGHITEKLAPMGTKHTKCTKCNKRAKKILSACAFELKGGGWYADGYSSSRPQSGKKSK